MSDTDYNCGLSAVCCVVLMMPEILESGGAKSRSSLQRSLYSISSPSSSSRRMLEADTMEEERREVRLLPLELLSSDMGEMQEERPRETVISVARS